MELHIGGIVKTEKALYVDEKIKNYVSSLPYGNSRGEQRHILCI